MMMMMMMMTNNRWVDEYEVELLTTTYLVLLYSSVSYFLKRVFCFIYYAKLLLQF
jgi:hypothetical protein